MHDSRVSLCRIWNSPCVVSSFPGFPFYFSVAVIAMKPFLWFFKPVRLWIFSEFQSPNQAQTGSALRQKRCHFFLPNIDSLPFFACFWLFFRQLLFIVYPEFIVVICEMADLIGAKLPLLKSRSYDPRYFYAKFLICGYHNFMLFLPGAAWCNSSSS